MWNANKCIRNRFGKRSYGWFIHKNRNRSFCASLDRWLLSQGQTDRAVSILRTFARINKKQVDESVYENLKVIDSLLRVWSVLLCNTSILFHHSAGQKEKKQKTKTSHHLKPIHFYVKSIFVLFFLNSCSLLLTIGEQGKRGYGLCKSRDVMRLLFIYGRIALRVCICLTEFRLPVQGQKEGNESVT